MSDLLLFARRQAYLRPAPEPEGLHPPGDWEALHPEFARRLHYFCADYGINVIPGHRTSDEQRRLYNCFITKSCNNGNPANEPGKSNHEAIPWEEPMALAADLQPESVFDSGSISNDEHEEIKRKYGVHFPLRKVEQEDHHAQPVEVSSSAWSGMPDLDRWDFSWRDVA